MMRSGTDRAEGAGAANHGAGGSLDGAANDRGDDEGASVCVDAAMVKSRPMLASVTPLVAILNPGDLLFVPSQSPHFVENLPSARRKGGVNQRRTSSTPSSGSDNIGTNSGPYRNSGDGGDDVDDVDGVDDLTMAISGNFLDESNLECAVDALERLAMTDSDTSDLLKVLQSPYFDSTFYEPAGDVTSGVPWNAFKAAAF